MKSIVVTPRSMTDPAHPSLERIRAAGYEVVMPSPGGQPTELQLVEVLREAVGYIAGVEKIPRAILEAAPALRAISRNGVGIDNVDLATARERGIEVLRAEGANARAVAELTLSHMFAACRRIDLHAQWLNNHQWQRRKGMELAGKTVGIVGCGRIGRMVASMCLALGMRVRAYDPYPPQEFSPDGDFALLPLPDILTEADVLTLHAPVPDDGTAILDEAACARLKPGVIIINTARFELIDPVAVRRVLVNGTVSVLTVDAFASEPPSDWSLIDHENVIATPHIGGFTAESVDRVADITIDNLLRALAKAGVP